MVKDQIITCPHCGNKTPHEHKHTVESEDKVFDEKGQSFPMSIYYVLVQCKTCQEVSMFLAGDWSDPSGCLEEETLLYPEVKIFSDAAIPEAVKTSYNEAKKVIKMSPTAFVVLIRRALEYVCNDKKAEGDNLKTQLDYLVKKKIIPPTLAKMSNALRVLGNIGAHASNLEVNTDDVNNIDDFFAAIIEYVYIAPEKIRKFEKSLKKKKTSTK